ncbi:hypothetical protein Fmac_013421 [Flemingia macrophylla]|uniref:DUF3741 domain-containing protein n=1 Tax=Flemingia macrophylla TaxID=520843 RepID=A0ABD1MVC8_9FABA
MDLWLRHLKRIVAKDPQRFLDPSRRLNSSALKMRVEKGGAKNEGGHGGFFHLFDWTSKSRKKLFETKSDLPGTRVAYLACDDEVDDDEETRVEESIRENGDHCYASSVIDDEVCGTKAPGVVARLMGLDSLPSSSFPEPCFSPYFDSQSLQDVQYWRAKFNHLHDHQILYSGKLSDRVEGSSRTFMEAKPQKTRRPIEKFQAEVMPPKSAKSIPLTHHKLLSPIKSPGFVPTNNATYIMEAAARIIEPGPQATIKAKTSLVASSSVSLRVRDLKEKALASQKRPLSGSSSLTSRVRDLKEKREVSHRNSRLSEPSQRSNESNDAKYLKGQSLNKSWNGSVDAPVRLPTQVEADSSLKNKGKSISLAIQAKANVQRREGLSIGSGKSLVEQKELCDLKKPQQPLKANVQKSSHKKSSGQDAASGVLRQNNLKQNCSMDKDKLPSKPLVSNSHSRKVLSGDSSCGRHRSSSSKSITKSKVGLNKSSMQVTDSEKEVLYTRANNFPRKKRSTDRDWNERVVDNLFIDKNQKPVQSNLVINKHQGGTEEVKKNDSDVVSFTFTTPLTRSNSGFDIDSDSTRSPVVFNDIGGDALGILLDQKLKELSYGIGNSCDDSFKARSLSSTAPKSEDLVPKLNSVDYIPRLQGKKDQGMMLADNLFSSRECDSFTSFPELSYEHRLWVDKMQSPESFNSGQPSPMSVLDSSFSTESYESPFSANAASLEDLSRRKQFVGSASGLNSSRKQYHPLEANQDLFDSASSWSMQKKHATTRELDYVNDILCNVELMYMDFALGRARDIVNPHLFNQLESRRGRYEGDGGDCRIRRKVLFDCVSECLDLRCRRYVGGGTKCGPKGLQW